LTLRGRLTLPVVELRPMVDCPVPSDGAAEWLEPDAGRLARPVLRGRWRSNAPPLPDIGVDVESGLVHSVKCTPANVHDITVAHELLHGKEKIAFADAGYVGIEKRGETGAVQWHVAMRPSKRRKLDRSKRLDRIYDEIERLKAGVRAKVEHPFRVLKCQFGYLKARYRGLAKNTAQIETQFALANLWMARKML
jgi:transposase, IS5 family